ncbi:MAG: hypothetical protein ACYC7B_04545 [Burkholderiales bacterium]
MSNRNTIADAILQQNNGQPFTIAAKTTLHQSFGFPGNVPVQVAVPNPMALIDANAPFPGRSANGLPFIIRAGGQVTGGEQYTIDINLGTGLTQQIATTGNALNGRVADNWLLEAECMWDPTSLWLRGIYYGWAGPVGINQSALATAQQPANLSALTFNCALTIINSNANALFTLSEFSIELV